MSVEIRCLGESFVAANICAANFLAFFQGSSGMFGLDVDLKLTFVGAFFVTEYAGSIGMFLPNVTL